MEILIQLKAKEKAESVITSCKRIGQLESARKYIDLYRLKFEDNLGAMQLELLADEVEEYLGKWNRR
jgi:ribosomal protein S8